MKSPASRHLPAATYACIILFAASFLVLAIGPAAARAQDLDEASISGRVVDQNGAIIPNATVTAVLVATAVERSVKTDREGRYRLIELTPGVYTVRASFSGFAAEEKTDLAIIAAQNVRLDFTLHPADVTAEPVVVSEAENSPVDTTRTVVGGTVVAEEIESLPIATRDPLDLIFTLGGVTEEPLSTRDLAEDRGTNPNITVEETGSFSLSGGPAYSNNITIDGLDNNDDRAARERFTPSVEAIEEVQVITNQFSSEYGRASGGRVNIRTRSGSNRYRGRLFYFFRDESLDANTFNNNRLGLTRLPLQQHNPGFTLGGPLSLPKSYFGPLSYDGRKKTFFFIAYEYSRQLDTALIDTLVPVLQNPLFPIAVPTAPEQAILEDEPSGAQRAAIAPFVSTVSTPLKNNIFTARVDHKFSDTHNATVSYQLGRLTNLRQFGGGSRLAEALQGRSRKSDAISYSDSYVFSPKAVNQMRAQYSRLAPAFEVLTGTTGPVVLITINDTRTSSDPFDRSGTLVAGSSTSGGTDRRETRFQVQDAFSYIAGSHSLKFGADFQRIRSTFIDLSDVTGTFNFRSAGDFLANAPSRFRQNFQTESTQKNTYTGFFIQDEWRLKPNIVLSYGLRYENESIIDDRNNFGPRVALAYDPFKTGKTVIRAGAGIFYNRALLRTIDDFTLGTQQLFFDTGLLIDPTTGKPFTPTREREFIAEHLTFPNVLTLDSPLIKEFGLLNTNFTRRLDPDLRIPESYQANIGFEREIGSGFVFEANYTYNRGIHLWREFNANAPRLPAGFKDFTDYLLSRDFPNFATPDGTRPIFDQSGAGEQVRFTLSPFDLSSFDPSTTGPCVGSTNPTNPDFGGCITEFGLPITLINLNSFSSSTPVDVALAALRDLRPDPTRTEVQQLAAIGNSFYHGLTLELRRRFHRSKSGLGFSFRAAYTYSHLTDDGIVNTSDALRVGDFRGERSRSLLDRRHRFVFSGTFDTPRVLGHVRFATILRMASGAPFNISLGGVDRNLDDIINDRPIFTGDPDLLRARRPGEPLNRELLSLFRLPTIGRTGDLPRNSGIGPSFFLLDINVSREFRLSERTRLRPVIEIDNVLNRTVFSFGTEFVDFRSFGLTATPAQRQAFLDSFLVTTRTLRPRTIRVGLRFDF